MLPVSGIWFLRAVSTNANTDTSFSNIANFISTFPQISWGSFRGYSARFNMSDLWDGSSFLQTGASGLVGYGLAKAQAQNISYAIRTVCGQSTSTSVIGNGATIAPLGTTLTAAGGPYTSIHLSGTAAVSVPTGTWITLDFVPGGGVQNIATFCKTTAPVTSGVTTDISVSSFNLNSFYGAIDFVAANTTVVVAQGAFCYSDGAAGDPTKNVRIVLPFWTDGTTNTVMTTQIRTLAGLQAAWCRSNGVHLLHGGWWGMSFSELANNALIRNQPGGSYAVMLQTHKDLFDAWYAGVAPGPDLALEMPMSGGGPLTGATPLVRDLSNYIASVTGGNRSWMFIQGNGLGPVTAQNWTSPPYADMGSATYTTEAQHESDAWTPAIGHGQQMINTLNSYNWDWVFSTLQIAHGNAGDPTPATGQGRLIVDNSQYIEIYDQSFVGGGTTATLASYMPGGSQAWNPFSIAGVPTGVLRADLGLDGWTLTPKDVWRESQAKMSGVTSDSYELYIREKGGGPV